MLNSDYARIERRLTSILADPKHGSAIAADLREGLTSLPDWMQNFLRPLLDRSGPTLLRKDKSSARRGRLHRPGLPDLPVSGGQGQPFNMPPSI